jgi:two-component system, NarL family, sensor histidine kinase UhpB
MKHLYYLPLLGLQLIFLFAHGQSTINDSLEKIVRENKMDTGEVKALHELAVSYVRTDLTKAKNYLYKSIELAIHLNHPILLSHDYSLMVITQLNTAHVDSSQYFLSLLKRLSETSGSKPIIANYHATAGLFYKTQGNFKAALPYMLESLKEDILLVKNNPVINNRVTLAGQYLNIGNTYTILGEYRNALQYHLKALQLFEELNNKKGISYCYQGIGGDFLELGQFKQALFYTTNARVIKNELGDTRGVATSLQQMGSIYVDLKKYDSALHYYFESLEILQKMKLITEEVNLNSDIGKLYVLRKDPANATLYYNNSRLLAQQTGDSARVAAADAALIALQTTISKQESDEKKLKSSLNTSIEAGDKRSELSNYQYLADHYVNTRQFEKALEYSNKFHLINDSLQAMDVQVQMKKMEEQYNIEKKEQEIALLKKDQQLTHLSLAKQKVFQFGAILFLSLLLLIGFLVINRNRIVHNTRRQIEMEKMRNRIAQDLHDDIGSTLTSITVLSNLGLLPPDKEESLMRTNLKKIKERSTAIMETMDDIVWAINPQNDTMEQVLFRMKEFASEILEPLNINYTFEEKGNFSFTKFDIKKRKDLYLIFKEAINNAAKYSRCRDILIRLQENQQSLQMEITDDGKGFDEQQIKNGNGLGNMRERAASMGAKILIVSTIASGTRISLDMVIT